MSEEMMNGRKERQMGRLHQRAEQQRKRKGAGERVLTKLQMMVMMMIIHTHTHTAKCLAPAVILLNR